ncbi:MAG: MotA/TolQ/ExbB proton channel family protein [Fuerstiella sp.]|nr:MotA/TolQ/ExbB proton channel family protein [Fuerstiella sp.]
MTEKRNTASGSFRTAFLATIATVLFYAVGPNVPGISEFVTRYFCSHPLEYISTAMFFTGLTILLQKQVGLRRERSILTAALSLPRPSLARTDSRTTGHAVLTEWCSQQATTLHSTHFFSRIRESLNYLKSSHVDGLEEHLRYLAELASERLHQSFATIRTITWAIPILGFLGTVIGITMAIANVTPDQLDSSLGEVTSGLAVAFDTTALALGMSIVLVFASFVVEQCEQTVLNDVERLGIEGFLPHFSNGKSGAENAEDSNEELLKTLVRQQSEVWTEQMTAFQHTWAGLLDHHADGLRHALDADLDETLKLHRNDAADTRDAYAAALQDSSQSLVDQTEQLLGSFEARMSSWQDAICVSSQSAVGQTEAIHELGATMLRMGESEERLVRLQQQLNENLQAINLVDTMEQTASSLTAAVHVLTAKSSQRKAA